LDKLHLQITPFFKKFVEKSPSNEAGVQQLLDAMAAGGRDEWVKELVEVKTKKPK
jgi:hypothetical protein